MNKNRILVLFGMLVMLGLVSAVIVPANADVQVAATTHQISPEVVDLSQLSLTQAGEDLNFLNKKLGEKMGFEKGQGPLEFKAASCREVSKYEDLILSEEPCLRLYAVEDKTLEESRSRFLLFFYNHYYPQKSEWDGEIACGEGSYDSINCLGSKAVVSPLMAKEETTPGVCAFAQDSDHKVEIIQALQNELELVTDLYFVEEFSGCGMLSPETVQVMEFYGFSPYSY